jgi:catechol 2,3-dioxygenase-like lactoylglutathione lyase family enzyme
MFLGLRTVIYHAPDLAAAKAWYATAFGVRPYFDEPFYVGFEIGGFELGLDPDNKGRNVGNNAVAYWASRILTAPTSTCSTGALNRAIP